MVNRNWGDYSVDGRDAGCAGQNRVVQAAGGFTIRVEKLAGLHTDNKLYLNFNYFDCYFLADKLFSTLNFEGKYYAQAYQSGGTFCVDGPCVDDVE